MTIWLIDLEAVDTRYTAQWKRYLPEQLQAQGFEVRVVSGGEVPQTVTPGAFLNFAGTNSYKSQQLLIIAEAVAKGEVKDGDYFLYTDAWNPTVIQLKYMLDLLGIKARVGGLWHAGNYDPNDFLGRLGKVPWAKHAELSMYSCYNDNFFATEDHTLLFRLERLSDNNVTDRSKIVGWPMEYMDIILAPYAKTTKKNKIIFPHRIAPEKQLAIFKDLAKLLPHYDWFVAQEQPLTKDEYHTHLAESKILFSANLQETLGITTCCEGPLVGTVPLAPNRLSYPEIFGSLGHYFLYPSEWTDSFESYMQNRSFLADRIDAMMYSFNDIEPALASYVRHEMPKFFHGDELYKAIKSS